jgi:TRAF3-interacting protein 1
MATEQYILDTQNLLQPLIKRPTLKDKHLQKPPFRFLHDILTGLRAEHNFPPDGLWPDEMLNSDNVKVTQVEYMPIKHNNT